MIALLVALLAVLPAAAGELTLWHGFRGEERATLEQLLAQWSTEHPGTTVLPLAVPPEALSSKLEAAVPRGNGPDLFVYAHEKIADWAQTGIILPVEPEGAFLPVATAALQRDGRTWGWPLSAKCLALFYNRALVTTPPATTDELLAAGRARAAAPGGADTPYTFAYEIATAYPNAAWMHGFGGGVMRDGEVALDTPENAAAFTFIQALATDVVPPEPSGTLVTQLFNQGRVASILNGPWFLGEIEGVDYGVAPLPVVSATGRRAAPYATIEAVFLARESADARALASWLTSPATADARMSGARQIPANADVAITDPVLAAFRAQLDDAVPMPTDLAFARTWEPIAQALRRLTRGAVDGPTAVAEAQTAYTIVSRPIAPAADPTPWSIAGAALALAAAAWSGREAWRARAAIRRHAADYLWVAPATVALGFLVFLPFVVGAAVSLFELDGVDWRFVGAAHFLDILFARDFPLTSPLSFWYTLVVTVAWTVANVTLHVGIGLALAMMLREPWVKLRGVFRALLILPWAVPSYITALAWKGMFHRQFGAINAILVAVGAEPVSWFAHFSTAFAANVATNTWLGFPFMMVVTLGALQSIPRDLEEAAAVDGASGWQRFRLVTLPLLKPALLPAVILGSVWTFNMFNIIYLVSAGEPDGKTDILISQAYRWAFTRGHRYGYAAAYAVLIFVVMLVQTRVANRLAGKRVV